MDGSRMSVHSVTRVIVMLLVVSGAIRLGGVGLAIAKQEAGAAQDQTHASGQLCEPSEDIASLLGVIEARTKELDAQELALLDRAQALEVAKVLIDENLERLAAMEENLAATVSQVDGASESDLESLTSVYESMKPKVAAALFEQMSPDFAAGFLGRMNAAAAAGIMSNVSSDKAYAISVVLAGRNANAPRQ